VTGLVRALKYKYRSALFQYRSTPVKITSASRTRQQQALEASKIDIELEPTDAGTSFFIFQGQWRGIARAQLSNLRIIPALSMRTQGPVCA